MFVKYFSSIKIVQGKRNFWLYDNFSGIEIKEPKPSILNVGNLSFQKHFVE